MFVHFGPLKDVREGHEAFRPPRQAVLEHRVQRHVHPQQEGRAARRARGSRRKGLREPDKKMKKEKNI